MLLDSTRFTPAMPVFQGAGPKCLCHPVTDFHLYPCPVRGYSNGSPKGTVASEFSVTNLVDTV